MQEPRIHPILAFQRDKILVDDQKFSIQQNDSQDFDHNLPKANIPRRDTLISRQKIVCTEMITSYGTSHSLSGVFLLQDYVIKLCDQTKDTSEMRGITIGSVKI